MKTETGLRRCARFRGRASLSHDRAAIVSDGYNRPPEGALFRFCPPTPKSGGQAGAVLPVPRVTRLTGGVRSPLAVGSLFAKAPNGETIPAGASALRTRRRQASDTLQGNSSGADAGIPHSSCPPLSIRGGHTSLPPRHRVAGRTSRDRGKMLPERQQMVAWRRDWKLAKRPFICCGKRVSGTIRVEQPPSRLAGTGAIRTGGHLGDLSSPRRTTDRGTDAPVRPSSAGTYRGAPDARERAADACRRSREVARSISAG